MNSLLQMSHPAATQPAQEAAYPVLSTAVPQLNISCSGEIRESRLYQLIRQKGPIVDRTFEIEFLDPGAQALDFTFG